MMNILFLHKEMLTQRDFANVYGSRMKDLNFSKDTKTEAMKVYLSPNQKKTNNADRVLWIQDNLITFNQFDYIVCTNADYFKTLTKKSNAKNTLGSICSSSLTTANIVYCPTAYEYKLNPSQVGVNINLALNAILEHSKGTYKEVGSDIIKSECYPDNIQDLENALNQIKDKPILSLDIETTAIKLHQAEVYSIGLAWDKNNGIAFKYTPEYRELLVKFFTEYQGKFLIHKANFDVMHLVYELFMNRDITDIPNQLLGINTLCRDFEDTLMIAYFATNNCQENVLSLKDLARPYVGNYAVDVSDVTKIELDKLLRYNLIDCLATHYVYEEYYPKVLLDRQEELYKDFKEYLKDNLRMQLNGLPIDLDYVANLKAKLIQEKEDILNTLNQIPSLETCKLQLAEQRTEKRNSELKVKVTTIADNMEDINYNSSKQLNYLLYQFYGLPVLSTTATGEPKTDKHTLKDLINHTQSKEIQTVLQSLLDLSDVEKILSAFIPAFEEAIVDKNGNAHLSGFFNLCGTVSGRMSSSDINLQQLPSTGSRFAKPVKECFRSTSEWVMCGIDFASLEDRIDALKTKDPEKLKVYLDGYDGHSLRAYYFFKEHMPDIELAEENEPCYTAKIKDETITWKASDKIVYNNVTYTGDEFYELVVNTGRE